MKTKLFSLIIILLAATCAVSCFDNVHPCGGVITEELVLNGDESIYTEYEGIYLTLEKITATGLTVIWHNDTDEDVLYGEWYSIEKFENNEWVSVLTEEMTVPAIAILLPSGGETEKSYSTAPFNISEIGLYRLRCEVSGKSTWVEFTVTEEKNEQVNLIPDSDLSEFAKFLDREGFVKDMSQGQLMALADKYSAELDPSIVPEFYHYDGEYGGGCAAYGEFFGYENFYYAKDGKVTYSNMLFTKVKIKSLKLPYGIKYGDGIEEVLKKLGIDREIYKNTAAYNGTDLVLYIDGTVSLTLVNHFLTEAPVDYLYDYELIYTEKISTVTRTVKLSFSDSEKELACIELKTVDEYEK